MARGYTGGLEGGLGRQEGSNVQNQSECVPVHGFNICYEALRTVGANQPFRKSTLWALK